MCASFSYRFLDRKNPESAMLISTSGKNLLRMTGLEPARRKHQNLNLARLPIPPHPHISYSIID